MQTEAQIIATLEDRGAESVVFRHGDFGSALSFTKDGETYRHAILGGAIDRANIFAEWVKTVV